MTTKIFKITETGRSITEIVGILALMALLTVVAVAGFKKLMAKHQANTVVSESKIAYMNAHACPEVNPINTWQEVSFNPSYNLTMQVLRDYKGNDYIKVAGVPEEICAQMLPMRVENVLEFYTATYEPLITCSGATDMIVAWAGAGIPAECGTTSHCDVGEYAVENNPEGFPGFCNAAGQCQKCDASYETLNYERTECTCVDGEALTCTDGTLSWCCGDGLICDVENKSCKDGGGACQYTFTQQTHKSTALCRYTIEDHDNGNGFHSITMTKEKGCYPDEYCAISYFDEWCTSVIQRGNIGSPEIETVWGTCVRLAGGASSGGCDVSIVEGGLTEDQGCPAGQYCSLYWEGTDCSTPINRGDVTGPLLGTCRFLINNTGGQCHPIQNN